MSPLTFSFEEGLYSITGAGQGLGEKIIQEGLQEEVMPKLILEGASWLGALLVLGNCLFKCQ